MDADLIQFCQGSLMDGLDLSLASAMADHEIVSNHGHWADIQQQNILTQLLHDSIHNCSCQIL